MQHHQPWSSAQAPLGSGHFPWCLSNGSSHVPVPTMAQIPAGMIYFYISRCNSKQLLCVHERHECEGCEKTFICEDECVITPATKSAC